MDIRDFINNSNFNVTTSNSINNASQYSNNNAFQDLLNSKSTVATEATTSNVAIIDLKGENFGDVDIDSIISEKMQESDYSKFVFELSNNLTFNVDMTGKLNTDKTDDDYTGTTFDELTDTQKQELLDILQNNSGDIMNLNDFLTQLVEFGAVKKSDADVMLGTLIPMYSDNDGNPIYELNTSVTRDDWNNSVVEWFCNMESNLVVKSSVLNSNENYSEALEYAQSNLANVRDVQSIIKQLLG